MVIQSIKSSIPLDKYVARYLTVKGGKALCPFHEEKTASFVIHRDYYKCFGCGASGDITKGQAIRSLANEAGIHLTRQPAKTHYQQYTENRLRLEADEWYRATRRAMVESDDYETSIPFLENLEAMSKADVLNAYMDVRTPEMASQLRASAAERAKPTVESLVREFLQWSR